MSAAKIINHKHLLILVIYNNKIIIMYTLVRKEYGGLFTSSLVDILEKWESLGFVLTKQVGAFLMRVY